MPTLKRHRPHAVIGALRRACLVAPLTLLALAAAATAALADTPRQETVSFPAPAQPPSLSPQTPTVDT